MTLFFYGMFVGFIIGGFFFWQRGRKEVETYKKLREITQSSGNPFGYQGEMSAMMAQNISAMVQRAVRESQPMRPQFESMDMQRVRQIPVQQSQRRVLNGQEIEVFDDGTWRPVE
jgi:hypothetical protein